MRRFFLGLLLSVFVAGEPSDVAPAAAPELAVTAPDESLDATIVVFDLRAGDLDGASELIVRHPYDPESLALSHRGLRAMDWMSRAFPRIKKKHVFRFAGIGGAHLAPAPPAADQSARHPV